MKTRVKNIENGEIYFPTLKWIFFAIGRLIIAILENFQDSDGSIEIPSVLRPYVNERNESLEMVRKSEIRKNRFNNRTKKNGISCSKVLKL